MGQHSLGTTVLRHEKTFLETEKIVLKYYVILYFAFFVVINDTLWNSHNRPFFLNSRVSELVKLFQCSYCFTGWKCFNLMIPPQFHQADLHWTQARFGRALCTFKSYFPALIASNVIINGPFPNIENYNFLIQQTDSNRFIKYKLTLHTGSAH